MKEFNDQSKLDGSLVLDILLDADGLVALMNSKHVNHEKAIQARKILLSRGTTWYISRYVVSEVATILSMRVSHKAAVRFLDDLKHSSEVHVIDTNDDLEEETQKIFLEQVSKNISYVDCHNVALIRRYKLDGIFSFDEHYRKNGVVLVT